MSANFKAKPLSYRQYTVLYHVGTKRLMIDDALELYKNTFMSLVKREYLELKNEQVILSRWGTAEMAAFESTKLADLKIKNQTDARTRKFMSDIGPLVDLPGKLRQQKKRAA